MTRRTSPSEDDWRNVEDAKKRKKIQDRLAQRARRQRLREAKNNSKPGSEGGETRRGGDMQHQQEESDTVTPATFENRSCWLTTGSTLEMVPLMPGQPICSASSSASPSSASPLPAFEFEDFLPHNITAAELPSSMTNPLPSPECSPITPEYPLTFYGALYINGLHLGIPCSTVVPAKSDPVGPDVPLSLQPTPLQLMTIHPRWIDRFPFPRMRDSLISLSGVVDDEEFMKDLALIPSFDIIPGKDPWDPRAWKIKKPFADKWGYLFF